VDDISPQTLFFSLLLLILVSAWFSASETAMLTLNRYRLRHLAKHRHRGAMRASALLENPDRLIGVILIGNNFVNVMASSLATILAVEMWGESGILIASLLMTAALLVFAEMTPKAIGAMYPEAIAFPSSLLLNLLLKLLHPLAWILGRLSKSLIKLLGIAHRSAVVQQLSQEELRTLVDESTHQLPAQRQSMLLNVLDLEKVSVNDIMISRNDVAGIDLDANIDTIMQSLLNSQHTRLPVFNNGDLNNVIGMLHMRNAAKWMQMDHPNKAELMQLTQEAYFVPEGTALTTQLVNFQKNKKRNALVVDEYGVVIGLITLEDILEEIVGNFTSNLAEATPEIYPQDDGTHVFDGGTSIREVNRALGWHLPTKGPKTLNGLLMEALETIPDTQVGIRLHGYCAEILQTTDNQIKSVRMWPVTQSGSDDLNEMQANLYD
jgi:Mg2+/Co2+ transporter CorB